MKPECSIKAFKSLDCFIRVYHSTFVYPCENLLHLFSTYSPFGAIEVLDLKAGVDFLRAGDSFDRPFLVVEGWVSQYMRSTDGRVGIVGLLLPGDCSELPLCGPLVSDFYMKSLTESLVIRLPALKVADIFKEENSILAQSLWRRHSRSIRVQRQWNFVLGQRTAPERLAYLVCELYQRMQTIGLAEGNSFNLPLSQKYIANLTGLSLVHLSKQLQEMRKARLIVISGRTVSIPNSEDLKAFARFSDDYLIR